MTKYDIFDIINIYFAEGLTESFPEKSREEISDLANTLAEENYDDFARWADALLENADIPGEVVSFDFDIYESDGVWKTDLIGSDRFDPNDEYGEWACYDIWSELENVFCIDRTVTVCGELILSVICLLVKNYLENGKFADFLKSKSAVAAGLAEAELTLLYVRE